MEVVEQIAELNKSIGEISKKLSTPFASQDDVNALNKAIGELRTAQKTHQRQMAKSRLGSGGTLDLMAGVFAKELNRIGVLSKATNIETANWFKAKGEQFEKAANLNSTDAGAGVEFLPETIDTVVSKLVDEYGVLPKYARVLPGVRGTFSTKKRNVRVTVGGMARGDSTATPAGSTYTEVDASTKNVNCITTVEEKLLWDSPINMIEEATLDLMEALAYSIDYAGFLGDASTANYGFTGIGLAVGVGNWNVTSTYTLDDVLNLRTKAAVSSFRSAESRYFAHPFQFAYLQTQKASTSGVYHFNPELGRFVIGGVPIEFTDALGAGTQAVGQIPWIFGNLRKAVTLAYGRGFQIRLLTELYQADNSIGVQLTGDVGMALVQPTAVARLTISGATYATN